MKNNDLLPNNAFDKWKWAGRIPSRDMSEVEALEWVRHTASWVEFPYGWWTEADGSHVMFDEWHRPICRKKLDGTIEIVRATAKIEYIAERLLYGDEGPGGSFTATKRCLDLVDRLGLREEIEYRIAISKSRGLPGGDL